MILFSASVCMYVRPPIHVYWCGCACMYIHTLVLLWKHVHICVYRWTCAYVWACGDMRSNSVFSLIAFYLRCWSKVSHWTQSFTNLTSLVIHFILGILASVSCTLGYQEDCLTHFAFTWVLGTRTPVLMMTEQALCSLSHSPAPAVR